MQEIIDYFIVTPIALYLFIGIFSLCIGSFLNVVIYRTPKILEQEWTEECQAFLHPDEAFPEQEKISLSYPASSCPHCHQHIRWYQNIPILSWIFLKGQCASCQCPISIRYPFIELITAICSLAVVYVYGATAQMLFGLIFT